LSRDTPDDGTAFASARVTAMSTLLLVNGEGVTEPTAGAGRPAARRATGIRGALERVGYEVVEVRDAATALQRLSDRPDLIVVSSAVPDMDLLDLCAALRKDPIAVKLPFVLVAEAAAKTGGAAAKIGADLIFPASVGPAEVADRLRRLF
jgi:CheY-like chemotaxis protein